MSFRPRMQSFHVGVEVVSPLSWRSWSGVVADVWEVACPGGAWGEYVSPDPRLFIVLEQTAGTGMADAGIDIVDSADGAVHHAASAGGNPICYIPADLRIWSRAEPLRRLRHLDLHFDRRALETRMGEKVDSRRLETPRLMFADDRVLRLARLTAEECMQPSGLDDMYGDGLINALLTAVLQLEKKEPRTRSRLSQWQLRRAVAYIEDNCLRQIRLEELAELTGLSQSYFSHAFKASTGLPPHRWLMRARIEKVKKLLEHQDASLPDVAAMTGFADQAHLTRIFRKMVGTTPAAWKRDHVAARSVSRLPPSGMFRPGVHNKPESSDPAQERSIQYPAVDATHAVRQDGLP
ncbi:AraC-like DNA-binding protein [Pseudochelatococcus lubricantis]|uniref:AraC-like DNA-binding protein n=1 Tax=Pseudochelatococcus lubricantis TaxID=1538102 RepID=A0ABX0UXF0_9HYPH|nr:AraC-like DNA-binding protein [Pseudochelatococcus lubricantis]